MLEAMLAPLIAAQTVSQLDAGVALSPGEVARPVIGFVVIAVAAWSYLASLLRSLGGEPSVTSHRRHAVSARS